LQTLQGQQHFTGLYLSDEATQQQNTDFFSGGGGLYIETTFKPKKFVLFTHSLHKMLC